MPKKITVDIPRLTRLLRGLGKSHQEVAAKLARLKLKGHRTSIDCPVYHYLDRRFPELEGDIVVHPSNIKLDGIVVYNPEKTSCSKAAGDHRLLDVDAHDLMPEPVSDFIAHFDRKEYPELLLSD